MHAEESTVKSDYFSSLLNSKNLIILFLVVCVIALGFDSTLSSSEQTTSPTSSSTPSIEAQLPILSNTIAPVILGESADTLIQSDFYSVVSVTDGDTFKIDMSGKTETVRIVGVNTPETVDPRRSVECFGKQSSDQLKTILTGQKVRLEFDETQSDRDRYQRLLRFVFLEGGEDVGLTLIKEGFAHESLYSSQPHKYREEYLDAQKYAQINKLGLWADDACVKSPITTLAPVKSTSIPISNTNKSCSGPDLDCGDFKTHIEAQGFFESCGFSKENDPMNLDGTNVGDGIACESLP